MNIPKRSIIFVTRPVAIGPLLADAPLNGLVAAPAPNSCKSNGLGANTGAVGGCTALGICGAGAEAEEAEADEAETEADAEAAETEADACSAAVASTGVGASSNAGGGGV